jgi:hypothetical protein
MVAAYGFSEAFVRLCGRQRIAACRIGQDMGRNAGESMCPPNYVEEHSCVEAAIAANRPRIDFDRGPRVAGTASTSRVGAGQGLNEIGSGIPV